jgi:hypothetical protein
MTVYFLRVHEREEIGGAWKNLQVMAGEERGLAELPKGVLLPWSF